jgi:hypothetical protein
MLRISCEKMIFMFQYNLEELLIALYDNMTNAIKLVGTN